MNRKVFYILFLVSFIIINSYSQSQLSSNNLKSIRVDNLSTEEIVKFKNQLEQNNVTIDQVKAMLLSKGLTESEYIKLKSRIENIGTINAPVMTDGNVLTEGIEQEPVENSMVKKKSSLVFGSELFTTSTFSFEPNLKLATPLNYILGPGDGLKLNIYGVQEYFSDLVVNTDGNVNIQYVGNVNIAGMTIEAATQKIKKAVSRIYTTVASGQSKVDVTIAKIRTIKVTIIGSQVPGNYSVSSLATVYNALFLSGGPGDNGSYRNIELMRDNKVIRTIDLYRFLVKGDQSDNVGLKDNDVIRIPAYESKVTLEGQVKRPGIFELKEGESFEDLLSFASGFNEFAYEAAIFVIQRTDKEYRVEDVEKSNFASYYPKTGDIIKVSELLSRFENRLTIDGAVYRPDNYAFYNGMRVFDLIAKADGLKDDAYLESAQIIRLKPDLTTEILNFNIGKLLAGDQTQNILLQREDVVKVFSTFDFEEEYHLTIDGEVHSPGDYPYHGRITLKDLINQAGGLTSLASDKIEVARMIKIDSITQDITNSSELFHLEITSTNREQILNFELKPFDVVNVRKMIYAEKPGMVSINGEVNYTGKYALLSKDEKIYSLIQRAGGLTPYAEKEGVMVKRPVKTQEKKLIENVNLNIDTKDSILKNTLKEEKMYSTIPIDWKKIKRNPKSITNITLSPGDEIYVSSVKEGVRVSGNVLLSSEIPFKKGLPLNYYVDAAGGVDNRGWLKRAYIVYPNGQGAVTKSFLFANSYPKVIAGSQIIVPEKPETKKMSTSEFVSIAGVLTSVTGLIIAILKL